MDNFASAVSNVPHKRYPTGQGKGDVKFSADQETNVHEYGKCGSEDRQDDDDSDDGSHTDQPRTQGTREKHRMATLFLLSCLPNNTMTVSAVYF